MLVVAGGGGPAGTYEVIEPEDLGVEHISPESVQAIVDGSLDPPEYSSVPATSGPHAPSPTPCGIYRQQVPEIFNIHALEHGAVIFYYREDILNEDERLQLEDLGRELSTHVIVMPFAEIEEQMALVAWGKLARLPVFDPEAAGSFWGEFAQLGPESGVSCDLTVDESEG